MSRDELIVLVRRIMRGEGATTEEADALVDQFVQNVPHPEADALIFHPKDGREPTAEEVVDAALAYKSIELRAKRR